MRLTPALRHTIGLGCFHFFAVNIAALLTITELCRAGSICLCALAVV
jgi:hypothetical protein